MAKASPPQKRGALGGNLLFWVALVFCLFQLTVAIFVPLIDLQLKSIHIIFGISTALLAYSFKKGKGRVPLWDWIFIAVIAAANINIFLNWYTIYNTPGSGGLKDWILGTMLILITLEATRRSTGWAMPLVLAAMFVYVFMGRFIPGIWGHPGFSFKYVIDSVYYSSLGIYGELTGYSATFVGVMIIFGSLLLVTGGGNTFVNVALLIAGRFRGGPAKVAIVSSALFGTISGSTTANVSVTGVYSIPLMKKLGYGPDFAAGVEAMASTGGIITPPILGITAFIMAQLVGVPYIKIAWYFVIPCLLYYTGLFAGVHFEALRLKLKPVPKDQIPHLKEVLSWAALGPLILPIVILIWLLLKGYDLTDAGFYACVAVAVLYIFVNLSPSGMKTRVLGLIKALSNGGQALSMIVPIFVTVGMLVNLLGITGVAPKISGLIVDIGGGSLFGALISAAIVPLVLGTALPTSATYLIAVPLIAPALINLNLNIVSVHMFLFYWAALAAITPPTCVPAVIAANIAGGNWFKAAMVGMRLGIVAFLMPFFFILDPALTGRGAPVEILVHFVSAMAGAILLASGLFGYMRSRTNIPVRVLFGISGLLLIYPSANLLLVGIGLAVVAFAGEWFSLRLKVSTSES
ncbi:MAG: TRAP transporter fused permease subunit [Dehalococcoidales bacterium]|nr:TRAP transporter fused permease subunit [Dehalococcoidales bacterium]